MPIIRKQLKPSDVYPETIRYNPVTDQVESLIDGEWVENPDIDPRSNTTYPPRLTSDTRCDAAKSIADALKAQIDQTIVAIDNGSTAFTIAGLILGLLSFGVFAIFISIALTIADAMIAAGASALTAALTPQVYEDLSCILYCQFDNSGRLKPGGLAQAQSDVTAQIGGLAATIINSMLQLAGEGGINNLAALGTSTGACIDCDCPEEWCFNFDFASSDGGWTVVPGQIGTYNAGSGWGQGVSANYSFVYIERTFDAVELTAVTLNSAIILDPRTSTPFGDVDFMDINTSRILETAVLTPPPSPFEWTGSASSITTIQILLMCGVVAPEQAPATGVVNISSVKIRGMGTCPFGEPNCE